MSNEQRSARLPTGFLLVRVAEAVDRGFVEALAALDLRPRHLRVLRHVHEHPARAQQDLAAALRIDAGNLIEILDELERMKILERPRDPDDRRRRLVALTDAGRDRLQDALEATTAVDDRVLSGLSAAQRQALHRTLDAVYQGHCGP